jgi:hypothetical protein
MYVQIITVRTNSDIMFIHIKKNWQFHSHIQDGHVLKHKEPYWLPLYRHTYNGKNFALSFKLQHF